MPSIKDLLELSDKQREAELVPLVRQFQAEYALAKNHQRDYLVEKLNQLKLYNNKKKNKDRVADLSIFSIMQTILAALYSNSLLAVFDGKEDGDDETAENLMDLAKYDYKVMKKHILDYFWIWDTCFNGRGIISLEEFSRDPEIMAPVPGYIDAMTFLRDPKAMSVNGLIHGDQGMRFGGYETFISAADISGKNGYFGIDVKDLTHEKEVDSLLDEAQEARDDAQGLNNLKHRNISTKDLGDNMLYPAINWYTHYNGQKVKLILGNSGTKILKIREFGESKKTDFPLVDRPLFPHSKSWHGVSIPDLVEDKQRHKSALLNASMDAVKNLIRPSYIYDEGKIKNKADLRRIHRSGKMIGVKGAGDIRGAIQPVNKADLRMDLVNYILDALDSSAQIATASPEMQQGQLSGQDRTLGELNLVQANVTKRQTLSSRIFSWSEEDFWIKYYQLYKKHLKSGIDEKLIRITGASGRKYRKLTRENLILNRDPDITIESSDDNQAKNARERILLQSFSEVIFSDPEANHRYMRKKLAKANDMTVDEIELLLPPTIDELIAEEENEKLSEDEFVEVSENDNHIVHLEVNGQAAETSAKEAHMRAHRLMMRIKRDQPELFPQPEEQLLPDGTTPTVSGGVGQLRRQASPTQGITQNIDVNA